MSSQVDAGSVYLQPHLLTKTSLINLLEQRCMNIQHMNTMSKEQLVELFQRIALPLPQRKYKQNHRGKLLTGLRNEKEGAKQKLEDISNVSFGFSETSVHQSRSNYRVGDRLKPPPDAVNFERKKIRLSAGNSKSNDLDHIQIKNRTSDIKNGVIEDDNHGTNKDCRTNISSSHADENPNGSAKIVLKRSHSASTKHSVTPEQEPTKKKEKKLITWP